jgi:hypothetical protein
LVIALSQAAQQYFGIQHLGVPNRLEMVSPTQLEKRSEHLTASSVDCAEDRAVARTR